MGNKCVEEKKDITCSAFKRISMLHKTWSLRLLYHWTISFKPSITLQSPDMQPKTSNSYVTRTAELWCIPCSGSYIRGWPLGASRYVELQLLWSLTKVEETTIQQQLEQHMGLIPYVLHIRNGIKSKPTYALTTSLEGWGFVCDITPSSTETWNNSQIFHLNHPECPGR